MAIVTQYVWVQRARQGYLNYTQHAGTALDVGIPIFIHPHAHDKNETNAENHSAITAQTVLEGTADGYLLICTV